MDAHVNTSRSVIPAQRPTSLIQYPWVPGSSMATPTVEWGRESTHTRKLFPATDNLGVSEMGNQAAYTAAANSPCFSSLSNNSQQPRRTLPALHVALLACSRSITYILPDPVGAKKTTVSRQVALLELNSQPALACDTTG